MKWDWPRMKFRSAGFSILTVFSSMCDSKQRSPRDEHQGAPRGAPRQGKPCPLNVTSGRLPCTSPRKANLAVEPIEQNENQRNHDEDQRAALRADGPAGEPSGSVKRRVQKVSFHHHSTVRDGIKEAFGIVPHGVHANGKPQTSGAPHGQGEEKADQNGAQRAHPIFPRISQVTSAEKSGKQNGRRPEAYAGGQGVARVSAHQKLFKEAHAQESNRPEDGLKNQPGATEGQASKGESVCGPKDQQKTGE